VDSFLLPPALSLSFFLCLFILFSSTLQLQRLQLSTTKPQPWILFFFLPPHFLSHCLFILFLSNQGFKHQAPSLCRIFSFHFFFPFSLGLFIPFFSSRLKAPSQKPLWITGLFSFSSRLHASSNEHGTPVQHSSHWIA
jgi:hypothetical protein